MELRRFLRTSNEYRVEYGLFPLTNPDEELKTGFIKNIGGGGLMFQSPDPFSIGTQLVLKIYITGWLKQGEDIVEAPGSENIAAITAIAEVTRCEFMPEKNLHNIGVQFLGRILG